MPLTEKESKTLEKTKQKLASIESNHSIDELKQKYNQYYSLSRSPATKHSKSDEIKTLKTFHNTYQNYLKYKRTISKLEATSLSSTSNESTTSNNIATPSTVRQTPQPSIVSHSTTSNSISTDNSVSTWQSLCTTPSSINSFSSQNRRPHGVNNLQSVQVALNFANQTYANTPIQQSNQSNYYNIDHTTLFNKFFNNNYITNIASTQPNESQPNNNSIQTNYDSDDDIISVSDSDYNDSIANDLYDITSDNGDDEDDDEEEYTQNMSDTSECKFNQDYYR